MGNLLWNEPLSEKTGFLNMRKTKPQISCAVTAQLISAFVFATWIVQWYKISSLYSSSVTAQPSLCQTWSKKPKTSFLRTRLKFKMSNVQQVSHQLIWAATRQNRSLGFPNRSNTCSATEDGQKLEISDLESRGIVLYMKPNQRCWSAVQLLCNWSAPFFTYMQNTGFLITQLI